MGKKNYLSPEGLNYYHASLMTALDNLASGKNQSGGSTPPATTDKGYKIYKLRKDIDDLQALLNDPDQVATSIDTFQEIVAFLRDIDPTGVTLKTFIDYIGDLSQLTTTNKNNLVAAINEVKSSIPTSLGVMSVALTSGNGINITASSGDTAANVKKTIAVKAKTGGVVVVDSGGIDVNVTAPLTKSAGVIGLQKGQGLTISNNAVSLKTASSDELGGIKTGYTASGNNKPVQVDANGNGYVTVNGSGVTSVTINCTSPISVNNTSAITSTGTRTIGLMLASSKASGENGEDRSGLEIVPSGDTNYNPGLRVKAGNGLQINNSDGTLEAKLGSGFAINTDGSIKLIEGAGIGASQSGVYVKNKSNGGIVVDSNGVSLKTGTAASSGTYYDVTLSSAGVPQVRVPAGAGYSLPTASSSTKGGIKLLQTDATLINNAYAKIVNTGSDLFAVDLTTAIEPISTDTIDSIIAGTYNT